MSERQPIPEEIINPPEEELPEEQPEAEPQKKVLHRERVVLGEYTITGESPEVMEKWHQQIQEIVDALQSRDLDKLTELMQGGKYKPNYEKIMEILWREVKNDKESLTLLGIALWILREQDKWAGHRKIVTKMLKGGEYSLSSFLETGGKPWCLESSVLAKTMAENFGIKGEVKKAPIMHRYFQADSGKILDVWWGYRRGGIFQNHQQWKEGKKIREEHPCGEPQKNK